MKTDNIVHKCACGLTYTAAGWSQLVYLDDWVDDEGTLEMRHCVCGSTRSIRIPQQKHEVADAAVCAEYNGPKITVSRDGKVRCDGEVTTMRVDRGNYYGTPTGDD